MRRVTMLAAALLLASLLPGPAAGQPAPAVDTAAAPPAATGFAARRPVIASGCPRACPLGELGDFVREAMADAGWEVIPCRNCNWAAVQLVATAARPPELRPEDRALGVTERIDAPVDFGITTSERLTQAYASGAGCTPPAACRSLRLIARIDNPVYLLVAVKAGSGITDLSQIVRERRRVTILAGGGGAQAILAHYGLSPEAVTALGGTIRPAIGSEEIEDFDVIVDGRGASANSPESAFWSALTRRYALRFLAPPEPVVAALVAGGAFRRVVARAGLLRGLDHDIPTVGRYGFAIFGRADMPASAAYALARAIDEHQDGLNWFVSPYAYSIHAAWRNGAVPLHPGAERYYRRAGYLR